MTFNQNIDEQTITITADQDSVIDNSETFTLTLRDPLYPSGNRGTPYSLTVTITDTDSKNLFIYLFISSHSYITLFKFTTFLFHSSNKIIVVKLKTK